MYIRSHWDVLLVDDDADVLSVTKLALKGVEVHGVPLKITACSSKAEALEHLQSSSEHPDLGLGLIDVVMETQHAGLELCQYIRETMGNRVTPLIVRTGQAGLVPEDKVVDEVDITAYITKVEATDRRLHTLVKSSLRSFMYSRATEGLLAWSAQLVEGSGSREALLQTIGKCLRIPITDRSGKPLSAIEGHIAVLIDDAAVGIGEYEDSAAARALAGELANGEPRRFDPGALVHQDDKVLLRLDKRDSSDPEVSVVARTNFQPMPDYLVRAWVGILRSVRGLWRHAATA